MKEARNEQEKKISRLRTYFGNNLTVIKDNGLFKVLFKLTSMQMKEYNKALKKEQATDNLTFQYSLNEFRLDLQMGKSTILKKFDMLVNVGLLTITKNCDEKNAYCKNTYQLNIEKLEVIIDTLNGMRRKERIEYINNLFNTKTSSAYKKINEKKFNNDEPDEDDVTGFDTENEAMKNMAKQMLKDNIQKQNPTIDPVKVEPKSIEVLEDTLTDSGEKMDLSFLSTAEEKPEVVTEPVNIDKENNNDMNDVFGIMNKPEEATDYVLTDFIKERIALAKKYDIELYNNIQNQLNNKEFKQDILFQYITSLTNRLVEKDKELKLAV